MFFLFIDFLWNVEIFCKCFVFMVVRCCFELVCEVIVGFLYFIVGLLLNILDLFCLFFVLCL